MNTDQNVYNLKKNISIITDVDQLSLASAKGVMLQQVDDVNFIEFNEVFKDDIGDAAWTFAKLLPYLPSGIVIVGVSVLNSNQQILTIDLGSHQIIGSNNGSLPLALNLYSESELHVHRVKEFEEMKVEGAINYLRDVMAPFAGLRLANKDYEKYLEKFDANDVVPFTRLENQGNVYNLKGKHPYYSISLDLEGLFDFGYKVANSAKEKISIKIDDQNYEIMFTKNIDNQSQTPYFFIDDFGFVSLYSPNINLDGKTITINESG